MLLPAKSFQLLPGPILPSPITFLIKQNHNPIAALIPRVREPGLGSSGAGAALTRVCVLMCRQDHGAELCSALRWMGFAGGTNRSTAVQGVCWDQPGQDQPCAPRTQGWQQDRGARGQAWHLGGERTFPGPLSVRGCPAPAPPAPSSARIPPPGL